MADQAQRDRFIEELTKLGGNARNDLLRQILEWDEALYNAVIVDLSVEGALSP